MNYPAETEAYGVYVKTDAENKITAINSSAFLRSTEGWTKIDEGAGDKYRHAQNFYLENGLRDDEGNPNYRLTENGGVEKITETA